MKSFFTLFLSPIFAIAVSHDDFAPPEVLTEPAATSGHAEALALFVRASQMSSGSDGGKVAASERNDHVAALLEAAFARDPHHLDLHRAAAEILFRSNKPATALDKIEQFLQNHPESVDAYLLFFRTVQKAAGDHQPTLERGRDVLEQASKKFPQSLALTLAWSASLASAGDLKKAKPALERAIAQDQWSAHEWLEIIELARKLWPPKESASHRKKIASLYRKAEVADGADLKIRTIVADFFAATKDYNKAIARYRSVLKEAPSELHVHDKLTRALQAAGQTQEALIELEKLAEIKSNDASLFLRLAGIYQKDGRVDDAIAAYEAAFAAAPPAVAVLQAFAEYCFQHQKYRHAADVLETYKGVHPKSVAIIRLCADAMCYAGRFRDAFTQYEVADRLNTELEHAARAAFAASSPEKNSGAEFAWENPLDQSFFYNFALAASEIRDIAKAEVLFLKSISLVPADAPEAAAKSYNGLAWLWAQAEIKWQEAEEAIAKALAFEPSNPAFLDTKGYLLLKQGKAADSLPYFLEAKRAAGMIDPVILDHLADAYAELGDFTRARLVLSEAIQLESTSDREKKLATWTSQ